MIPDLLLPSGHGNTGLRECASDKARAVVVEVPFRTGIFQHRFYVKPEPGKDHRELVHQSDIEVALDAHIGEYLMKMVGF